MSKLPKCPACNGVGYIESHYGSSASFTPSIKQCCDITAYSREVQRRLAQAATPRPVLQSTSVDPAPKRKIKLVLLKSEQ